MACDDGNKTVLDCSQGMAPTGPLSCSPPDSSGEAAVEKWKYRSPRAHPPPPAHAFQHPSPRRRQDAGSGQALPAAAARSTLSSPTSLPVPLFPIPLSGIYKHFPQINIGIDYSLWASRVSLVIQPGRVSSQRLLQLRGEKKKEKKNPQKARGTQILLGLPLPATETDGEEGRKKTGMAWKGMKRRGSWGEKARAGKTKSPLENWCRGTPAAWRDSQPCARRSAHRCGGLIAPGAKSDSRFWYLLRKSFGGIPWLADRKGRKQQQWGKTRSLPPAFLGIRVARAGWSSSLLAYDMQKENN